MGLSQSSLDGQDIPSLNHVLSRGGNAAAAAAATPINWDMVRHILRHEPEQACMYAHGGVEDSQLHVALQQQQNGGNGGGVPLDVVQMFVNADEDALDHVSSRTGCTVLHAAARNPHIHPDVIQYLLKLRRSLAQTKDRQGCLPLHGCTNPQAAKFLIQAYPNGVVQRCTNLGNLPLHYALLLENEGATAAAAEDVSIIELLKILVTKQQSITSRNKRGQTPLQLLLQKLDREPQPHQEQQQQQDAVVENEKLWQVLLDWTRLYLTNGNNNNNVRSLELHAMIAHGCCNSVRLMNRALKEFGDQAYQRDESSMFGGKGRTPLHVAAATGTCTTEALEVLLASNPNAPRMTDKEGRLPIDVAAESPFTEVHSLAVFMKGEPRAIDTRDLRDGNYPFVSAALGQNTSINSTYFLLRAKPHVLSYFHLP